MTKGRASGLFYCWRACTGEMARSQRRKSRIPACSPYLTRFSAGYPSKNRSRILSPS